MLHSFIVGIFIFAGLCLLYVLVAADLKFPGALPIACILLLIVLVLTGCHHVTQGLSGIQ
ncbi:MAG TPA: hypothetical protein VNV43_08240 [Candidatus Acidoferrales bacterium]|nr:hypothetical protein [Candidatus Acidoferrales bacterium]